MAIRLKKNRESLKELKKINEQLKVINQRKSDFISAVSHELRTPLTSIREGVLQVLDGTLGKINGEQKDFLGTALEDIDRLKNIANTLLDISKIDAGRIELKKTLVDMRDIIRMVSVEFKSMARVRGVTLDNVLTDDTADIFIDKERIIEVLSNLISNACKFTRRGGKITIRLTNSKDEIEIAVEDTGIGIAKTNIPKLFDRFEQFGRAVIDKEKGTGLGLAISKGIVDMHRGRIWVESALGKGSAFKFSLPKLNSESIFKEYISGGIKEAVNKETGLSVVVLKIEDHDYLKKGMGDIKVMTILKGLEDSLKVILRGDTDVFLRHTGECVVLLFGTNREGAMVVKNKISAAARRYLDEIQKEHNVNFRISLGVSTYPEEAKTSDGLLLKARVKLEDMYLGPERRRYLRRICKLDIKSTDKKGGEMQTVDISEGGVCIFLDRSIKRDQESEFVFELPKEKTIKVRGRMAWIRKDKETNKYRAGFEFLNIKDKDRLAIRKFIETGAYGHR